MMHDPVQNVLSRLRGVRANGTRFTALCPAHDDHHQSLSVAKGDDGRALVHCHVGCELEAVCSAVGLTKADLFVRTGRGKQREIVAIYDYVDADSQLLYQVVRFPHKRFRQRRPDGRGGWLWKLNGTKRVLFRLPQLLAADASLPVFIPEGEKDAMNLAALDLVATTNAGGAHKWPHLDDDSVLEGRDVVLLPDKDAAGYGHAGEVGRALLDRARSIRWLVLPGEEKDVSDWLLKGGSRDELVRLAAAAPAFDPSVHGPCDKLERNDEPEVEDVDPVELGERDPESGRLVLSPRRTMPTAEVFVRQFHTHPDGRTLLNYGGELLEWSGNRYRIIEDEALRHRLQPWLHDSLRHRKLRNGGMVLEDFESNPATVNAALDTIKTYTHLPISVQMPAWLSDNGRPPAAEFLPCRACNVHLPTGEIIEPTPSLFITNALAFDYEREPEAPERWIKFLEQLFGDDLESVQLLQEWFGYTLTLSTALQKMLLVVGPRRSGKGTIARVHRQLIGEGNVAGPTVSSLAKNFGLQPLIGKSLAIVSDARFAGENMATVTERLLCISGEDAVTIDRKHKPAVTMKLPTRFMFLTNELPRFSDASNALAGRFMILRLTRSFYDNEDPTLTDKLLEELPGILTWSIEGWKRVWARGRFVQPASAEDAIRDLEDLSSPVQAFVRERCEVHVEQRVDVDDLYAAWRQWCEDDGRTAVTSRTTFGRDLAAAVAGVCRSRSTDQRPFYRGIGLMGEVF